MLNRKAIKYDFQMAFSVYGIRCWDCTSTAGFCDDPFDENNVSDREKTWSYIECLPPSQSYDQRAVCKKIKQIGKCSSTLSIFRLRIGLKMRPNIQDWSIKSFKNSEHMR